MEKEVIQIMKDTFKKVKEINKNYIGKEQWEHGEITTMYPLSWTEGWSEIGIIPPLRRIDGKTKGSVGVAKMTDEYATHIGYVICHLDTGLAVKTVKDLNEESVIKEAERYDQILKDLRHNDLSLVNIRDTLRLCLQIDDLKKSNNTEKLKQIFN